MKTAVSLPDEVFDAAERLARRSGTTRSGLYSQAIAEYVARHEPDRVTAAMDLVLADVGVEPDPWVTSAARRILRDTEW